MPNRLIHEKSPYLLQHAENPVNWYPWGDEAFERARTGDRPIFLSIGYSTCHWCHVMENESFENEEVASLMNRAFVSMKVDREERPDIDAVYMKVCQMITGSGGWPLTIIMTPDKVPFFAGTYIPRESMYGRMGLIDLIPKIEALWNESRGDIDRITAKVMAALQSDVRRGLDSSELPGMEVLDRAYEEMEGSFDADFGGFGASPKFPSPSNFLFLLRYHRRNPTSNALSMVMKTLSSMRRGGVYDQLGFGFHRYATDREWLVPHFEKMLYDQALLMMAYTEAYQLTAERWLGDTVREVFTYVSACLTSPGGGFYSAEDADSEGEEGLFYLWTSDEVERLLGPRDSEIFEAHYGMRREGNYREEAGRMKNGRNILHRMEPVQTLAERFGFEVDAYVEHLELLRRKMFEVRRARIHPQLDDKILTDWNGLMITALARAGQAFDEKAYSGAAETACGFILSEMMTKDGGLLHRYRDGEAAIPGYLDDYAAMALALIDLYEATFKVEYLERAVRFMDICLDRFSDGEGGFYQTSDSGEVVLVRDHALFDGAVPSGNGLVLNDLLRLGHLTGNDSYRKHAENLIRFSSRSLREHPTAYTFSLASLDFFLGPNSEVVIVGPEEHGETADMARSVRRIFAPSKVLLFKPTEEDDSPITRLSPFTGPLVMVNGSATCYVCTGFSCSLPTNSVDEVRASLGAAIR